MTSAVRKWTQHLDQNNKGCQSVWKKTPRVCPGVFHGGSRVCCQVGHEPLAPTLGRNLFGRQVYQLPGLFAYGGSLGHSSQHSEVGGTKGGFHCLSVGVWSIVARASSETNLSTLSRVGPVFGDRIDNWQPLLFLSYHMYTPKSWCTS